MHPLHCWYPIWSLEINKNSLNSDKDKGQGGRYLFVKLLGSGFGDGTSTRWILTYARILLLSSWKRPFWYKTPRAFKLTFGHSWRMWRNCKFCRGVSETGQYRKQCSHDSWLGQIRVIPGVGRNDQMEGTYPWRVSSVWSKSYQSKQSENNL